LELLLGDISTFFLNRQLVTTFVRVHGGEEKYSLFL